jgi:hypothetical protein
MARSRETTRETVGTVDASNVKIQVHSVSLDILSDVQGFLEGRGYWIECLPLPGDAAAVGSFFLHPLGTRRNPG